MTCQKIIVNFMKNCLKGRSETANTNRESFSVSSLLLKLKKIGKKKAVFLVVGVRRGEL